MFLVDCLIPDIEKFKEAEQKEFAMTLPRSCSKVQDRIKSQQEKTHNLDIEEDQGIRPNHQNILNQNQSLLNFNHHDINMNRHHKEHKNVNPFDLGETNIEESTGINNNNFIEDQQSFINRKITRQTENNNNDIINNFNSGVVIRIKITSGDENDSELKKFFLKTNIKLQENYTLEFISRFICYKQNFQYELLKKISFYTLNNDKSKKYWAQSTSLKELMLYKKENKVEDPRQEELTVNSIDNSNRIEIFFAINQ